MPSGAQIDFSDASKIETDEPADSTFPLITCSKVIYVFYLFLTRGLNSRGSIWGIFFKPVKLM